VRLYCCWILLAWAAAGCATAPPPRAVEVAPRDAATEALGAWVGPSQPFVLSIHPARLQAQQGALSAVVGQELGPVEGAPLLAQLLFGTLGAAPEAPLAPLEGLDEGRPVLLGFFSTGPDRGESLVAYGGILDPEEAPTFLHARAVLPCADVGACGASVARWSEALGLGEPAREGEDRLWEGARMMLLASARGDVLRLDLAINVRDPAAARAWLRERAAAPPAPRPPNVAWDHFVEGDGAAAIYTDMEALSRFYVGSGMLEAAAALEFAAPESRDALMSYAMALVLRGARALNAHDRDARAVTWSASGEGDVVTLRSTRSLSARALSAATASREQAGRTWRARAEAPLLELRLHQSLRALAEARGLPAWAERPELRELSELVRESGSFLLLYALQNEPLAQWIALAPDPAWLPDSATVVVEEGNLDPERGLFLSGAVALDYPAQIPDGIPAQLERWKRELEQNIQGIPLTLAVAPDGDHTRVLLGVTRPPAEVLRLDSPSREGDRDLSVRVDMERLQRLLSPLLWGSYAPTLPGLRSLTLEDVSDARGHASRWQISARALPALASAPPVLREGGAAPPPARAISPGERCLLDASREMASGLMARHMVHDEQRAAFEEAIDEVVQEALGCAKSDPAAAALAREVEARWRLQRARGLLARGQEEAATDEAARACEGGLALACGLQRRLAVPWDAATLREARAPWPASPPTHGAAPILALTQGEIWFDRARVGEIALLQGDAAPLREALGAVPEGAAVELRLDQGVAQRDLLAALWLLKERGLGVVARAQSPDGRERRFLSLAGAASRAGAAPRLWLRWGAAGISLRSDREDFGVLAPQDLPALAEQIAQARGALGDMIEFHLLIESPELPWEALAPVLGALHLPDAAAVAVEIDQLQRLRELQGLPPLTRPEAITALLAYQRPPAPIVLGSAEPEATRRKKLPRAALAPTPDPQGEVPDKEGLRRALRVLQPQLRRCYEAALANDPDALLRFSMGFTVGPDGEVDAVELKGLRDDQGEFGACVTSALQRLRFRPPAGGGQIQVSWPMVFHPRQ
jgi:hypothetical protein